MKLKTVLENNEESIIREATDSIGRTPVLRYQENGERENLKRITLLFEKVRTCIEKRDSSAILDYTGNLARERFKGEYPLHEVLTAFNALEEVIWRKITEFLEPADYAEAFRLVSTVFGFGKERLATEYVALAANVPSIADPLPDLRN